MCYMLLHGHKKFDKQAAEWEWIIENINIKPIDLVPGGKLQFVKGSY